MELGTGSRERGSSRIPPSFRLLFQHKAYLSHAWSLVLMFFITTCHHSSHRRFAFIFFRNTHEKIDKKQLSTQSQSRCTNVSVPYYYYVYFRYIFALPWISRCNTTCIVCFHVRICSRWAEKTLAEFRSRTLSRSGCFVRTTTYTSSDPAHGVSSKTVSYCSPQLKPRYIHFHSSFVVSSLSRFFSLSISFHDKLAILFIVFQIASLKPILRHLSVSQWYKMNPFSYVFKIVTKTDMVYPCSSSSDNILWLFRPELQ